MEERENAIMQLKFSVESGENSLSSDDINNLWAIFNSQEVEIANKDRDIEYLSIIIDEYKSDYRTAKEGM